MSTRIADVVIVGAGASGLTAARDLIQRGLKVIVLEARDRVGGRLNTETHGGAMIEIGGQWVSPDQYALKATLKELGLQTFKRHRDGANVYIDRKGRRATFSGDAFPVSAETQREMTRLLAMLDAMTGEVDPEKPWAHPRAKELDSMSFARWLELNSQDQEARDNVAMFVADAMLTKPPHAFSVLQALLMASSAGTFTQLADPDFMLDERVVGSLHQVPSLLAKKLGPEVVLLNQPVRTVRWNPQDKSKGVTVLTDKLKVEAKQVILAVPPPLVSRMHFEPALPRRQHQLHQHLSMGFVIKVQIVYSTPFWRDAGLSGTAFSPYELVHEVYDNTNHGDKRGMLVAFVSDEYADDVFRLSGEERKKKILTSLSHFFGPQALKPEVYYESDWGSEEWTRGAYAASFDLGGLARYGQDLRAAVGPIRFSSSDLAGHGYQHVEGAIRMGHMTADAICTDFKIPVKPRAWQLEHEKHAAATAAATNAAANVVAKTTTAAAITAPMLLSKL